MEKTLGFLEKQRWAILGPPSELTAQIGRDWLTSSPRQSLVVVTDPVRLAQLQQANFVALICDGSPESLQLIEGYREGGHLWDKVILFLIGAPTPVICGSTDGISLVATDSAPTQAEFLQAAATHAHRHLHELLDREVAQARTSGMLRLLIFLTGGSWAQTFERARIASSLAQFQCDDPSVIQRAIRIALYESLPDVPGWREIAESTPAAASVRQLLEQRRALLPDQPWPTSTPMEIVLAEIARLAIDNAHGSEKDFRDILKRMSASLPFSLRTAVRNSADRVLRTLWERRYDVA